MQGQHQRQTFDLQATAKMHMEAGPDATDAQRAKTAQAVQRMNQAGGMKLAMQMQQTLKVDAADADGWLPMTLALSSKGGKIEMDGKTTPLPNDQALDTRFNARFNPKDFAFDVKAFEGGPEPELNKATLEQSNAMIGEALQLSKALAQHPLKIGESVDVPMTLNLPVPLPGGASAMQSTVRYTLNRVDKGVAYFDLGMDLQMTVDVPVPATPDAAASAASSASVTATAPQTLRMVMSGSGKGTSSLRLADRLQLASRLAMDMQMTMAVPGNTLMRLDMNMLLLSKGESLAKPAAAKAPGKKKP